MRFMLQSPRWREEGRFHRSKFLRHVLSVISSRMKSKYEDPCYRRAP